jgi:RNA polymerase sigma-70 factor (ECF subfamily)
MANKRQPGDEDPLSTLSDEALMAAIGRGDPAAFRALIERHRGMVVGLGWRMTGNQADGEDIAQEVFARVWVNAARWVSLAQGGTGKFSTWLYRVTMNLCIDRSRRPKTEAIDRLLQSGPEMADDAEDAETGMARSQVAATVAKAVAALPARQGQAIVLCVYEEMSNAQAGEIMNLSIGAVESLLVRARRRLKETLAPLRGAEG